MSGVGTIEGGRERNTRGEEMKVVSTTDVTTAHDLGRENAWTHNGMTMWTQDWYTYIYKHIHTTAKPHTHVQYLSGHTLAGIVLQKESYHLQVILLGGHVQWSEAILHTKGTKHTHMHLYIQVETD